MHTCADLHHCIIIHHTHSYMCFSATPPSPVASCSLTSSDDGARFFLQWSMAFSVQHDVDMYRVTTVPHSSSLSCSSDQLVEPSGNYSCSGLAVDMHYLFTVSAINCVDQESPPLSFTLTPQGRPCVGLLLWLP